MRREQLIVLKFGGSVLRSQADLPLVTQEIYRWVREGWKVIAVVSAFEGRTDELLSKARAYGENVQEEAVAQLVSLGEQETASLLTLTLHQAGIACGLLDAAGLRLRTTGPVLDSEPVGIDVRAVHRGLRRASVCVVPGFLGRDGRNQTTLLGRGGSDLTALYLAEQLNARCRLIKDVDGLYDRDPADRSGPAARRFATLRWEDSLKVNGCVLQGKAAVFAAKRHFKFEVATLLRADGTSVGEKETTFHEQTWVGSAGSKPLRVGLLGLGTVGKGVYETLKQLPRHFEVVGALVRDPSKPGREQLAKGFLVTDPHELLARDCDVIIEAVGGTKAPAAFIEAALRRGCHVVSANKSVIEKFGPPLEAVADQLGRRLAFSACVGGAVPMIKQVRRLKGKGIRSIHAVVNATTNFILKEVSKGVEFGEAVKHAQRLGLAEPDPSRDLDGRDAAEKLAILAREALGVLVSADDIRCEALTGELIAKRLSRVQGRAGSLRIVASVTAHRRDAVPGIRLRALTKSNPLSGVEGDHNGLIVVTNDGRNHFVTGRGAGPLPTAAAIVGDLFEIALSAPASEVANPRQHAGITGEKDRARQHHHEAGVLTGIC